MIKKINLKELDFVISNVVLTYYLKYLNEDRNY